MWASSLCSGTSTGSRAEWSDGLRWEPSSPEERSPEVATVMVQSSPTFSARDLPAFVGVGMTQSVWVTREWLTSEEICDRDSRLEAFFLPEGIY